MSLVPLLLAQPALADDAAISAILAGFRGVLHVEARYLERRYLAVLRTPLESRGTLRFDAPDRLEKRGDPIGAGPGESLVIAGGQLTLTRPDGAPVALALREHPEIGALVESMRALLAGDDVALRRNFDLDLAGDAARWQLVLRPHRADLVRWVRIDGAAARITRVETQEADGDRSEMTIEPPP